MQLLNRYQKKQASLFYCQLFIHLFVPNNQLTSSIDMTLNNATINWADFIKHSFFAAWEEDSDVDISTYFYRLEDHFDLKRVEKAINKIIENATDREKEIRLQKNKIKIFIHVFVEALLQASDDAKTLNAPVIEKAKHMLLNEPRCKDYGVTS